MTEGSNMKEKGFAEDTYLVLKGEPTIQGHSQSFERISGLNPSANHIIRFVR